MFSVVQGGPVQLKMSHGFVSKGFYLLVKWG